jgi:NAD dependent epimerase/dehydratase family enzyme
MTDANDDSIDWSLCTWKASRRRQHQEWHLLSFAEKLTQIEEMNDLAVELSGKSLAELNEQSHREHTNESRGKTDH